MRMVYEETFGGVDHRRSSGLRSRISFTSTPHILQRYRDQPMLQRHLLVIHRLMVFEVSEAEFLGLLGNHGSRDVPRNIFLGFRSNLLGVKQVPIRIRIRTASALICGLLPRYRQQGPDSTIEHLVQVAQIEGGSTRRFQGIFRSSATVDNQPITFCLTLNKLPRTDRTGMRIGVGIKAALDNREENQFFGNAFFLRMPFMMSTYLAERSSHIPKRCFMRSEKR